MILPGRAARLLAVCCLLLVAAAPDAAFAQAAVQRVDVQLTIDGPTPHALIRERLTATVQSVADRLLTGRPLDQLPPGPRLGETIGAVLDRVAAGYAVGAADVQLGAVSVVLVRLRPLPPIIQDASVTPDLRTLHARLHPLAADALGRSAAGEIRALFVGLPAAAMAWAEPILETRARELVEEALPGFTALVRARVTDGRAAIEMALLARDTRVIRNIGVRFRSASIPSMLLDQHGPAVVSMADPLRGLPVVFAEAHRAAIERLLTDELAAYPPAKQYRIVATIGLDIGETTFVTVLADSLLYRARVEAQLNVGTRAPGPAVVGHVGRLVTPGAEAFLEIHLVPNTLALDWHVGTQVELSPGSFVGLSYSIVPGQVTAFTSVALGRDTGLRGAWNLSAQNFEGAITYRFNENLTGEIIGTTRGEWWLRLISNL